jgi:hypothetical protein
MFRVCLSSYNYGKRRALRNSLRKAHQTDYYRFHMNDECLLPSVGKVKQNLLSCDEHAQSKLKNKRKTRIRR